MTQLLPPSPAPFRADGRFRTILRRAEGLTEASEYHWPTSSTARYVTEAKGNATPNWLSLLNFASARIRKETARSAVAMCGGFAVSVGLVMASGMVRLPSALPTSRGGPIIAVSEVAAPSLNRSSAFAASTLLPIIYDSVVAAAKEEPVLTIQRKVAVRNIVNARAVSTPGSKQVAGGFDTNSRDPESVVRSRREHGRLDSKKRDQAMDSGKARSERTAPWQYDTMRFY